jgi:hypothetical protein
MSLATKPSKTVEDLRTESIAAHRHAEELDAEIMRSGPLPPAGYLQVVKAPYWSADDHSVLMKCGPCQRFVYFGHDPIRVIDSNGDVVCPYHGHLPFVDARYAEALASVATGPNSSVTPTASHVAAVAGTQVRGDMENRRADPQYQSSG